MQRKERHIFLQLHISQDGCIIGRLQRHMYTYLPELQSWHVFAEEADAGREKEKATAEVISTTLTRQNITLVKHPAGASASQVSVLFLDFPFAMQDGYQEKWGRSHARVSSDSLSCSHTEICLKGDFYRPFLLTVHCDYKTGELPAVSLRFRFLIHWCHWETYVKWKTVCEALYIKVSIYCLSAYLSLVWITPTRFLNTDWVTGHLTDKYQKILWML